MAAFFERARLAVSGAGVGLAVNNILGSEYHGTFMAFGAILTLIIVELRGDQQRIQNHD